MIAKKTTKPFKRPFDLLVMRNCDYFINIGKQASIKKLAEHQQAGTLHDFISEVAPDYINGKCVMVFSIVKDLESIGT
jgi:hypothetical protein